MVSSSSPDRVSFRSDPDGLDPKRHRADGLDKNRSEGRDRNKYRSDPEGVDRNKYRSEGRDPKRRKYNSRERGRDPRRDDSREEQESSRRKFDNRRRYDSRRYDSRERSRERRRSASVAPRRAPPASPGKESAPVPPLTPVSPENNNNERSSSSKAPTATTSGGPATTPTISIEQMLATMTGRPLDALRRDLRKGSTTAQQAENTKKTVVGPAESVQERNKRRADRRRAMSAVNGMKAAPVSKQEKAQWAVAVVARAGLPLNKKTLKELQRRVHPDKQLDEDKADANRAFQRLRDVEEGLRIRGVID